MKLPNLQFSCQQHFLAETVNQIDFGFDASFFGGRLNTSFDWYRRNTKDMLTAGQALPAVLGTSVPQENAADSLMVGDTVVIVTTHTGFDAITDILR